MLNEVFKAFEFCEKNTSRTAKTDALLPLVRGEQKQVLEKIFDITFNPYRRYGIILKAPEASPVSVDLLPNDGELFEDFLGLVKELETRSVTGGQAADRTSTFFSNLPALYAKWFTRIINKDLKCGVGPAVVDDFFPGMIPDFPIQLADKMDELPAGTFMAERKLDGLRGLVIPALGTVMSRGGRELYNCDLILSELSQFPAYVFDGELLADNWNETAKIVRASKSTRDAESLRFVCFDIIKLEDFKAKRVVMDTYVYRRTKLAALLERTEHPHVVLSYGELVHSPEEAMAVTKRYVAAGYEGSVLKAPDGLYEYKRSKTWLKVKFQVEEDVLVTGAEEGTGRNEGKLGALHVRTADGREFKVGGGFSDEDRVELWRMYNSGELCGMIVEIEYEKAAKIVGRFPQFTRLRTDKTCL